MRKPFHNPFITITQLTLAAGALLLSVETASAQCGLIVNGAFESGIVPQTYYASNMAGGHAWEGQIATYCSNWESPTEGRPQYEHLASQFGYYNPLVNPQIGTAMPHSGKASVLLRNGYSVASPTLGQVRDYISQSIPVLESGHQYYAECWARIPTTTTSTGSQATSFIGSGFGLSFTNGNPTPCPKWDPSGCEFEYELSASPFTQVLNINQIDDQNWHRISGSFRANGAENFVTVGLFAGSTYVRNKTTGANLAKANVYVDDVSVSEIPRALGQSCPTSSTSVTLQTATIVGCPSPGFQFTWTGPNGYYSQGTLNPTVSPFQAGIYTLSVLLPDGNSWVTTTSVPPVPCWSTPVLVNRNNTKRIEAYPNPASEHLAISVIGSAKGQAVLYDGQGLAVETLTLQQGKVQLSTEHLRAGIYHLRVVTEDGSVLEKQISITH